MLSVIWSANVNRPKKEENHSDQDAKALVNLNPIERIVFMLSHRNTLWSGISVILGIISALISLSVNYESVHAFLQSFFSLFISAANAQTANLTVAPSLKSTFIGGMMVLLSVLFFWALFTLTFSKQTRAITVATEAVKTLMGFFIGTLTGFSAS